MSNALASIVMAKEAAGVTGSDSPGQMIHVHLPENMDKDDIIEVLKAIEGMDTTRQIKKYVIGTGLGIGALVLQYYLEEQGLSPPVMHTMMAGIGELGPTAAQGRRSEAKKILESIQTKELHRYLLNEAARKFSELTEGKP